MGMRVGMTRLGLLGALCLGWASAGTPARAAGGNQRDLVVLDTAGFWRMHHTFRQPVMQAGEGLVVIPRYEPNIRGGGQIGQLQMWHGGLLAKDTPSPPADWTHPQFDDSSWVRGTAYRACRTPYLGRLCLRGKFTVSDPAKAGDLGFVVDYHGGARVYLNGKEIARQDIASDASLARAYPLEAFVGEDGKLISLRGEEPLWKKKPAEETARRIVARVRTLSVALPAGGLRAGVNTLCVELLRAPYHGVVEEQQALSENHGPHKTYDLSWNTCQIRRVRLMAASGAALAGDAVRPPGLQVWNSDPLATDYDLDFGDPAEPVRPIALVGARNGTYSGKVVAGSDRPLRGLSAAASDLKGEGGAAIPASQVRFRYGMPWGDITLTNADCGERIPYPAEPSPLVALFEAAPQEVPVYRKPVTPRCLSLPGQPEPVFGAVVPVWVTVSVPKAARPGAYQGQVTLRAEGLPPTRVSLRLKVLDYALPDATEWKTWVELIQSPDTLAAEYGAAMWSERHWEMISRSLAYLREVGSGVLFVPLIAKSNAGNEESMVRWKRKEPNGYGYDFSIMDRYLDLAQKEIGPPKVVIFNVWDRYLIRKDSGGRSFQVEGGLKASQPGPLVTFLEAGGKKREVCLPDYTEAGAKEMWKPLFDQLRQRMKGRGLEGAMQIGMISDFWATKEQTEALKEITGDLPWANAGHYVRKTVYDGLARFGYQSSYFGTAFGYGKSLSGWKGAETVALFERVPLDVYPMAKWRLLAEQSITGSVRGVGRLGADTWQAVKDKGGKRLARVWERYPGSNWGYLNANCAVLAPGPDGAVATMRFEALREGVQECEAVIVLEGALMEKTAPERLGSDRVKKCQALLDERRQCLWRALGLYQSGPDYSVEVTSWRERQGVTGYTWFLGSGWQERSERLYTLAGEVQSRLAAR